MEWLTLFATVAGFTTLTVTLDHYLAPLLSEMQHMRHLYEMALARTAEAADNLRRTREAAEAKWPRERN